MPKLMKKNCQECGAEFEVYPQHFDIKKRCNACQNQFKIDKSVEFNRQKRARLKEEARKKSIN